MVDWNTSAVGVLMFLVAFYIVTLSTYTYYRSLPNENIDSDSTNKSKREIVVKFKTDLWQSNITINKCCGQNQIINHHNKCESQEYKVFNPNDITEKLEFFVVDENMKQAYINPSRVHFAYNFFKPSFSHDAIVVNWVLNDDKSKNRYYFYQQDASLLELDPKGQRKENKFGTNSYCLDENNYFGSGLIAYINPCIENVCIRKCCPINWYYNTMQQDCVTDSPAKYVPKFYFTTSNSQAEVPYYLMTGIVKCSLTDSLRPINKKPEEVFIQEDGFLMIIDQNSGYYYYYDNKSYCVDLFSNGIETPYVNGFHCQKEANFMRPADVDINKFAHVFRDRGERTSAPLLPPLNSLITTQDRPNEREREREVTKKVETKMTVLDEVAPSYNKSEEKETDEQENEFLLHGAGNIYYSIAFRTVLSFLISVVIFVT